MRRTGEVMATGEGARAAAAWRPPGEGPTGLYVHVPFCVQKCGYCDFFSIPLPEGRAAPDAGSYLRAVAAELRGLPSGFAPRTLFVGGGTPTELSTADLERLLALLRERIDPARLVEWTCEANPGTLTREKVRLLLEAGVTRISLGVQSFRDETLRFLERIHTADEARRGFALLREEGARDVNLDLISAIPGAPPGALEADLREAARLGPEHIACYALTFEEGTAFGARLRAGRLRPVADEEERAQLERTRALLAAAGYAQYEVSNFHRVEASRDLRCRHNLLYWGPGQFHAVGPAAHGHVHGERFGNVRNLALYCARVLAAPDRPGAARAFSERLEPEAWAREALVQWLRQLEGVAPAAFAEATGFALDDLVGPAVARLVGLGLLQWSDAGRLRLTDEGLYLSDSVFAELI